MAKRETNRGLSSIVGLVAVMWLGVACSGPDTGPGGGTTGGNPNGLGGTTSGGAPSFGGASGTVTGGSGPTTGGTSTTGGASTSGGAATGGAPGSGGASTGGAGGASSGGGSATGGSATGGVNTGGSSGAKSSGGANTGGANTGGSNTGGSNGGNAGKTGTGGNNGGSSGSGGNTGGANTGGSAGGGALKFSFHIGADVSDQENQPEATRANLLSTMKAHGFNSVRLRIFVDPKASDGYDKNNGYCDLAHTISFGKQIKDAGMGFLLDFHYSDNWADPGKQCVPVAWQGYTTITQMVTALHDYTKDAITKLVAGGARPDMVQVGNETTPGMLLHRCDSGGQPTGSNPVTGSTSNWANLGALLKAGVDGVKEVDSSILVSFHIDRGGDKPTEGQGSALQASTNWITNALKYTPFDAFGESCYQRYQGDPNSTAVTKTGWTNTFTGLATKFPNIKFFAAEYGPMQREINDVVFNMANQQGIGTFNWEPTTQGDWNSGGHDLLRRSGSTYTAQPDLALYDLMKTAYASRL